MCAAIERSLFGMGAQLDRGSRVASARVQLYERFVINGDEICSSLTDFIVISCLLGRNGPCITIWGSVARGRRPVSRFFFAPKLSVGIDGDPWDLPSTSAIRSSNDDARFVPYRW